MKDALDFVPRRIIVLALFSVATVVTTPVLACTLVQPLNKAEAISPYESHQGFVDSTKPVRMFVEQVTRASDRTDDAALVSCAMENLRQWVESGGLEANPDTFEGYRQLIRYAFSLNMAVGKLSASGVSIDAKVYDWLRKITTLQARYFTRHLQNRGSADNLYVWSGAAAGTFLLMRHDEPLESYADEVWSNAMKAIGPDGRVRTEVARSERALAYHTYYLSAAMWLKGIRQATGRPISEADGKKLELLRDEIVKVLCSDQRKLDGQPMTQLIPSFTSSSSLQVLDRPYWNKLNSCGVQPTEDFYNMLGGSLQKTSAYMSRLKQPK